MHVYVLFTEIHLIFSIPYIPALHIALHILYVLIWLYIRAWAVFELGPEYG